MSTSEVGLFSQIASGGAPPPTGAPAQAQTPSSGASSEVDMFSQIASGKGKPPNTSAERGAAQATGLRPANTDEKIQSMMGPNAPSDFMQHGDKAAGVAASIEGGRSLVNSATAPGIPAGAATEELAGGLKVIRDAATGQFVKAAPSMVGKIPGILKSAYDWASANPVKAYAIYKIADEAGIGVSGLKKVFHLFSGAEE